MFRTRIKSSLFIDFENVGHHCSPDRFSNWLQWIEDGEFDDDGRKRHLVEKRVYWNPSHQRYKDAFERNGFEVVLCEKLANLKNGADIRIALDVMERLVERWPATEYILFAQDTDYVPVLQRLRLKAKQSAILVDEKQERVFSTYDLQADICIPLRVFREEAVTYVRPRPIREAFHALKKRLASTFLGTNSNSRDGARAASALGHEANTEATSAPSQAVMPALIQGRRTTRERRGAWTSRLGLSRCHPRYEPETEQIY